MAVGGNLYLSADAASNVILDAATNDVAVSVTGDLDFTGAGDGTESLLMGDGIWTVGGNVNFTNGDTAEANWSWTSESRCVFHKAVRKMSASTITAF